MPEMCENADPAVTETDFRYSENPLNTLFECVNENKRTAKTAVPVSGDAVPACSSADPVDLEKACGVELMSLDEVLNMSASKIRNRFASQGIEVPSLDLKN